MSTLHRLQIVLRPYAGRYEVAVLDRDTQRRIKRLGYLLTHDQEQAQQKFDRLNLALMGKGATMVSSTADGVPLELDSLGDAL